MKESDLYLPVKQYLQALNYQVKAEVKGCDIVAQHQDSCSDKLIVELKLSFSLELIHQGIDRQRLSDRVYLAVPAPETAAKKRNWRAKLSANIKLCRLLGLGLMTVDITKCAEQSVKVLQDPAPYAPRLNLRRRKGLDKEFSARAGDPNIGGVNKLKIVTAYRQQATLLATELSRSTELSIKELKKQTNVENTAAILQKNYYGWFERVSRGVYCLSEMGKLALCEA